jgi:hypothetical protein
MRFWTKQNYEYTIHADPGRIACNRKKFYLRIWNDGKSLLQNQQQSGSSSPSLPATGSTLVPPPALSFPAAAAPGTVCLLFTGCLSLWKYPDKMSPRGRARKTKKGKDASTKQSERK